MYVCLLTLGALFVGVVLCSLSFLYGRTGPGLHGLLGVMGRHSVLGLRVRAVWEARAGNVSTAALGGRLPCSCIGLGTPISPLLLHQPPTLNTPLNVNRAFKIECFTLAENAI